MNRFSRPLRTHTAWGLTKTEHARIEREVARLAKLRAQRLATVRVRCNAKTRKGTPCKALSERGKRRCKFHGGKSTGPKTLEGKARISAAQRMRWAAWRKENKNRNATLSIVSTMMEDDYFESCGGQ